MTHRRLPLPLRWQRAEEVAHDAAVTIGAIESIEIRDEVVWGEGTLFDDLDPDLFERLLEDVREAMLLLRQGVIGPSVDAGAAEVVYVRVGEDTPLTAEELDELWWDEMETGQPAPVEALFTTYEISGATLVATPAFAECQALEIDEEMALTAAVRRTGWDSYPFADRDMKWDGVAADERISAQCGIGTDDEDWDSYASAHLWRDDTANPETKGAYKLLLLDLVDGQRMIVPHAVWEKAVLLQGGRHGIDIPEPDQEVLKEVVAGLYERMAEEWDDPDIVAPWEASAATSGSAELLTTLTAAASRSYSPQPFVPPATPPAGLVPMTVTDDGEVHGHIATHDVCHRGIPGVCMTAPVDLRDYDRFHRYQLPGADGEPLAVGRITFGGGRFGNSCPCCQGNDDHACDRFSYGQAIAQHDQMDTVAWVRAWEDEANNAIWVSGVVAEGTTPAQIRALARGRVSGDWRHVGGDLALTEVLVLSRERPGFPLPRGRMAAGQMMALTGAGTIYPRRGTTHPPVEIDYGRLSAMIADRLASTPTFASPPPSVASSPPEVEAPDLSAAAAAASDALLVTLAVAESAARRRLSG